MKRKLTKQITDSGSSKVWLAVGGLVALGITIMILRETPAMRRELKILRM
jgi:hypothetical protein